MNTQSVISVKGLSKYYGAVAAIEDVSFSVLKGEVVGFVGLNGAGKSTTINLMLGFLRASSGRVNLMGQPVTPETAHLTHQKVGFASGDMALPTNLTGKQYLRFLSGRYKLASQKRVEELSKRFEPELSKKIGDLSRGNKQKIALIAAFMHKPSLVVLDEPSSGLDPMMQEAFLALVREEGEKGTTIFMSSHYLNEVADVCSRVLLMRRGKLVKDILAHQIAAVSGKSVRIITERRVAPPQAAEMTTVEKTEAGWELNFIYQAKLARLQQWIAGVPGVADFSVSDHDLEAAFSELYLTDSEVDGV